MDGTPVRIQLMDTAGQVVSSFYYTFIFQSVEMLERFWKVGKVLESWKSFGKLENF